MGQVLLTIPDENISMFLDFIRNLKFVQKAERLNNDFKPLTKEDWALPGKPATDEEFEQMMTQAEAEGKAGLGMTAAKARKFSENQIEQWLQNHK